MNVTSRTSEVTFNKIRISDLVYLHREFFTHTHTHSLDSILEMYIHCTHTHLAIKPMCALATIKQCLFHGCAVCLMCAKCVNNQQHQQQHQQQMGAKKDKGDGNERNSSAYLDSDSSSGVVCIVIYQWKYVECIDAVCHFRFVFM